MGKEVRIPGYERSTGFIDDDTGEQFLGVNFGGQHYILSEADYVNIGASLDCGDDFPDARVYRWVKDYDGGVGVVAEVVEDRGLVRKVFDLIERDNKGLELDHREELRESR
jgi:hypothetical protein